jgi:TIR domain-containing protein
MAHPQASSLRIFVSYRHDDVPAHSGRLADRLVHRFGEEDVFLDMDAIDPGMDFRVVLRQAIDTCDVVIVVIGPKWLDAREPNGARRLDHPNDYVRLEIEAALDREIRIIPVLVDGTQMPTAEQLPEELVPLCYRNAVEMGKNFHTETTALISKLERIEQAKLGDAPSPPAAVEGGETAAAVPPPSHGTSATRQPQGGQIPALEDAGGSGVPRGRMRLRPKPMGAIALVLVALAGAIAAVIALTGGDQAGQVRQTQGSLASLVPFFNDWNCKTAQPSSPSVKEQAACSPGQGAEKAQLALFKSKDARDAAYMERVKRADTLSPSHIKPNSGKCTRTDWGGEIEWTHAANVPAGRELCYVTSAGSDLAWTYMDAPLLVAGHRSDTDHPALFQWFEDHAHQIDPGAPAMGGHHGSNGGAPVEGGHQSAPM